RYFDRLNIDTVRASSLSFFSTKFTIDKVSRRILFRNYKAYTIYPIRCKSNTDSFVNRCKQMQIKDKNINFINFLIQKKQNLKTYLKSIRKDSIYIIKSILITT